MQQPVPPRYSLSRAQVREIDRRSSEEFHIPGIVLMENAARAATHVACDMLRGIERPAALVICGGGNNGGDGLAVARHLHNHAVEVTIAPAVDPESYRGDALVQWKITRAMKLHTIGYSGLSTVGSIHMIIDGLFGTGLQATPRDMRWIDWMNGRGVPLLALDLPSGMDCDTGKPLGPACVRATRTVTFVAEKAGFANPLARQYLGEVTVGDIGCPHELIQAIARAFPG